MIDISKLKCLNCGVAEQFILNQNYLQCDHCGKKYEKIGNVVSFLQDYKIEKSKERKKAAIRHWKTGNLIKYLSSIEISDKMDLINIGGGNNEDKYFLKSMGFNVTSIDVTYHPDTDFICDAHCLPFNDNSFYIATSVSVFEHLHSPEIAFKEVYRVLKPGGYFIGSLAFLEPYHSFSYKHLSPLGLIFLAQSAKFQVVEIGFGWDVFSANLIALFKPFRLIRYFIEYSFKTIILLRVLIKRYLKRYKNVIKINGVELSPYLYELLCFAGSITFKLKKTSI